MRIGDVRLGAALLAAGLAILVEARGFPTMAGLPYGPGLFPSIAAVGLMACGAMVALGGWRRGGRSRSRVEPGTAAGDGAAPPSTGAARAPRGGPVPRAGVAEPVLDGVTTSGAEDPKLGPARALRVVAVPLAVVFFGLALDPLGFHLTATAALVALFVAFGLGPVRAAAFAVVAALAIHGVFYSLLRVPLPWGVLTPVAW